MIVWLRATVVWLARCMNRWVVTVITLASDYITYGRRFQYRWIIEEMPLKFQRQFPWLGKVTEFNRKKNPRPSSVTVRNSISFVVFCLRIRKILRQMKRWITSIEETAAAARTHVISGWAEAGMKRRIDADSAVVAAPSDAHLFRSPWARWKCCRARWWPYGTCLFRWWVRLQHIWHMSVNSVQVTLSVLHRLLTIKSWRALLKP